MIVVYILILLAIIIYYITRPVPNKKRKYKVAKAGDVEHLTPLTSTINDLTNKSFLFDGENVNVDDYEVFIVDGESMSNVGIHTGNGVLVSRLFDKTTLEKGSIIIYEIDKDRYLKDHPKESIPQTGFKIRQFLDYVNLDDTNNLIYNQLKKVDTSLEQKENKDKLFFKLNKARESLEFNNVILSITFKEGVKQYSVHSFSELYGLVKYIIPKEYIKNK